MTMVPWWLVFFYVTGCHSRIYKHGSSWNGYEFHTYPHPAKKSAVPRDTMVDTINNLGLKLLAIHNEYNENNIAISPYGALSVLVALGEGLEGDAVQEIKQAVHLPNDISTIRVGLRDIHRHLKSYFIPKEGFLAGLTLNHENVTLRPEYEEILKFYGYDTISFNSALFPPPQTTEKPEIGTKRHYPITTDNPTESVPTEIAKTEPVGQTTTTEVTTEAATETTETTVKLTTETVIPTTTVTEEITTNKITTEKTATTLDVNTISTLPQTTTTEIVPVDPKILQSTSSNTVTEELTTVSTQETTKIITTSMPIETTEVLETTTVSGRTTRSVPTTEDNVIVSVSTATSNEQSTMPSEAQDVTTISTTIQDNITTTTETTTNLPITTIVVTNPLTISLPVTTTSLPSTSTELYTTTETDTLPTVSSTIFDSTEGSSIIDLLSSTLPSTSSLAELTESTDYTNTNSLETTESVNEANEIHTTETSTENVGFGGVVKRKAPQGEIVSKTTNVIELNKREEMLYKGSKRNSRSIIDYVIARYYDDHYLIRHRHQRPYIPKEDTGFLVYGKYKEYNINFMRYDTVLPFCYVPHLNSLALSFPLDSTKYYLLLLLPVDENGIDKLICDLRLNGSLKYIIANLRYTRVIATIPSFTLKGYVTLTPSFQKLGIRRVFEPRQADFTPMTNQSQIYVTNIEQAITVTIRNYVDPETMHNYRDLHQYGPVHFKADHPFLYFVIDTEINVTLMAGKIVNPLNSRIS